MHAVFLAEVLSTWYGLLGAEPGNLLRQYNGDGHAVSCPLGQELGGEKTRNGGTFVVEK
jgi:hypothetical protein